MQNEEGKHTCITLWFECGKLLRQSHHVIYFCAIHNGKINTDEKLICSMFTLANCVNYILYRVCYISQCMNRIIWTKKLLALPIKFCQVVHTRILFWKHLPLQDSCMIFLGWGMVVVVLLFLNSIIDFPAFYQTSVCLSCTAYILFLSRNSCYSSIVHTALLLYGCLWAQVCEHRYRLCITHCLHTATCNRWNCFCEVMEILGCWLSLVFFKALYFLEGKW